MAEEAEKNNHKQLDYHQDYPIVKSPLFVCRALLINDSNHPHSQDYQLSASWKNIRRSVHSHIKFLFNYIPERGKQRQEQKRMNSFVSVYNTRFILVRIIVKKKKRVLILYFSLQIGV